MANRMFPTQFIQSTESNPVRVHAQVTFGASGAPTLNFGSKYISGIVRNSAGNYTLTFTDVYNRLLGIDHIFNSGSSAPAAPQLYVKTNSLTTASAKTINVIFANAGTATDPATSEIVYLTFNLKN